MFTFTNRFLTLLLLFLCISNFEASAQQLSLAGQQENGNYKFGHINSSELVEKMPEYAMFLKDIEKLSEGHQKQLELMNDEYLAKIENYNAMQDKLAKSALDERGMELEQLAKKIHDFSEMCEKEKQEALEKATRTIKDKVKQAVMAVEKKYSYTHIFDIGIIIYFNPAQSTDVMPLVKKELGIK